MENKTEKKRKTSKVDEVLKKEDVYSKISVTEKKPAPKRSGASDGETKKAAPKSSARKNIVPDEKNIDDQPLLNIAPAAPVDVASFMKKIKKYKRDRLDITARDPGASPVRVIPLGGLEEIGKNMTIIEYGDDAIMIDCGQAFPNDDELFGVDVVIPDMTYIAQISHKLRGIVITHGHEDHIGCLPFLLRDYPVPVFGTKLTIGLLNGKLRERDLADRTKLFGVVNVGEVVDFGEIKVEFFRVNHSIPDAAGLAIHTPAGIIIHTGDFKIDPTPISGGMIDLPRLAELGQAGVLLLMSDSTNSERPGYTMTESKVGQTFDSMFKLAENQRVIIATFASNIHRIQQIVDAAVKTDRKVAVSGRSMINTFNIATELGYLEVPEGLIIELEEISEYPPERIVLVTTGSQGEPLSALSRMAFSDHRKVEVSSTDFIIISATPIPGNERMVSRVVNRLLKLGARVIYERMYDIHVSGHACQEEQKVIMSLVRPKFFVPVHGEYKHFIKHAATAQEMGIPKKNIVISENGSIIEMTADSISIVGSVPSGRVFVDGLGVGDVGSVVLRDRRLLSQDGVLTVAAVIDIINVQLVSGPEIVSRGFVFIKESEELISVLRNETLKVIEELTKRSVNDINIYRNEIREALSKKIYNNMKRSPVIIPLIMEI